MLIPKRARRSAILGACALSGKFAAAERVVPQKRIGVPSAKTNPASRTLRNPCRPAGRSTKNETFTGAASHGHVHGIQPSNTNYIHRKFGWGSYPFVKHFEKLILSYEIGALKPEPAIYKAVEEYTKRPPEEHIFIDDVMEYAEAARNLGWDAIHFNSYEQTTEELK